ncbi:hypothetical protein COBT_001852 [Conglomerata obtusa]
MISTTTLTSDEKQIILNARKIIVKKYPGTIEFFDESINLNNLLCASYLNKIDEKLNEQMEITQYTPAFALAYVNDQLFSMKDIKDLSDAKYQIEILSFFHTLLMKLFAVDNLKNINSKTEVFFDILDTYMSLHENNQTLNAMHSQMRPEYKSLISKMKNINRTKVTICCYIYECYLTLCEIYQLNLSTEMNKNSITIKKPNDV